MRKAMMALLIGMCGITSQAQTKPLLASYSDGQPVYFVDSVQVNEAYTNYISSNDIASVQMGKNPLYPNGSVYITLKDHHLLKQLLGSKLLSLQDITDKESPAQKKQVIYLLDNKLLLDTAGVRIPEMYVRNVKVVKAADAPYFKTAMPKAVILMISTKPQEMMLKGITDIE